MLQHEIDQGFSDEKGERASQGWKLQGKGIDEEVEEPTGTSFFKKKFIYL